MNLPNIVYEYAKSQPAKRYTHISPSSLGYCHRAHFYKIMGITPTTPPNPGALLNFELGRLWEVPVENALRHAQVLFMSQMRLEDLELGVGGTLDVVLVKPDSLRLVSIKTEGKDKAKWRNIKKETFFESNPEYGVQEAVYKILLERKGFTVDDTASYLVITKDNGYLDEPMLSFTPKLMDYTLNRIKTLQKALKEAIPPDCECEGWKINYCSFGDPESIEKNKTGKMVPMRCCQEELWLAR